MNADKKNGINSSASIRVHRRFLISSLALLALLAYLAVQTAGRWTLLAAAAVATKPAPASRFVGFDCIEFDGWADSMGKRNFAPSPRAMRTLGESRP
jgi:hypothetical protein